MGTPAETLNSEQLQAAREWTAARGLVEAKMKEYESACVLMVASHVQQARDVVHSALDAQFDAYERMRAADLKAGQI
jgi:hypothetical protein